MPSKKTQQVREAAPLLPIEISSRYTVPEALARLRVCRATFYKAVRAGEIKLISTCGRKFVGGAELAKHMGVPT